jgi:hypothetical protein
MGFLPQSLRITHLVLHWLLALPPLLAPYSPEDGCQAQPDAFEERLFADAIGNVMQVCQRCVRMYWAG